jgi:hypothetical protein
MTEKFHLDANDCAALIVPLSSLRVAIAAAIGCTDFGARHVEYYCAELGDDAVYNATRTSLREHLQETKDQAARLKRRLNAFGRGHTVLGAEIVALVTMISEQIGSTQKSLDLGLVEPRALYWAKNLAQSTMRLLTGRLERIAQGYIPEPTRSESFTPGAKA